VALIGAGLWDGVMGHLGRYIWWPLLLWLAFTLLKAYLRQAGRGVTPDAPHDTPASNRRTTRDRGLIQKTAAWLRDQGITWREVGRLRAQLAKDSADPRVRELRQVLGS
jgi:hypothetical protein